MKQTILDDFRAYRADQLRPDERADYEGDRGQITGGNILANVEREAAVLIHHGHVPVVRKFCFQIHRDEEYGLEIGFDADGKIT